MWEILMKVFGDSHVFINQPAVFVFFWRGEEQGQSFYIILSRVCVHMHAHACTFFLSKQKRGYLNGDLVTMCCD